MLCLFSVAAHADKNRMLPSNLGVVFGPTLMRPAEDTVAGIVEIKYQNEVTEIMIKEYTKVWSMYPLTVCPLRFVYLLQIFTSSSPQPTMKRSRSLPAGEAAPLVSISSISAMSPVIEENVPESKSLYVEHLDELIMK